MLGVTLQSTVTYSPEQHMLCSDGFLFTTTTFSRYAHLDLDQFNKVASVTGQVKSSQFLCCMSQNPDQITSLDFTACYNILCL